MSNDVERPFVLCLRAAALPLALDIGTVERASYLVAAQPVPGTPDYVVGIANVAGETVPLADLAVRLGLDGPPRYSVDTPVVWCRSGERMAGFVVDQIVGVGEVDTQRRYLEGQFADARSAVRSVVYVDDEAWLLLDAERLLAFDFAREVSELVLDPEELRGWLEQLPEQRVSNAAE